VCKDTELVTGCSFLAERLMNDLLVTEGRICIELPGMTYTVFRISLKQNQLLNPSEQFEVFLIE